MLKVRVTIENTSNDKIVEVPGWVGGGDLIGQGVGQLLGGEVGQAVQTATATAKLTDNAGNPYKQAPAMSVFGAQIELGGDHAVRPWKDPPGRAGLSSSAGNRGVPAVRIVGSRV